jgi:HEPN domain-containing protein
MQAALVSVTEERNLGAVYPPWETAPYGVVSLLAMLEFSARDYLEISHQFGMILAVMGQAQKPDAFDVSKALQLLLTDANRLGLKVTREALGEMLFEMSKTDPESVTMQGEGDDRTFHFKNSHLGKERICHHLETIYSVLKAELRSICFRIVPSGKVSYCDPQWLFESPIYKQFPNAWKEFQSAGRCYAYGENTGCAFHLQRALEWGLKSLAVKLNKRFDRNNWEKHLEDIEKELKARYSIASARTPEEKFYSESAVQFGHMKVAWRNPTMHIEAKYDEGEAEYLLVTVEKFMNHLAKNNIKEELP